MELKTTQKTVEIIKALYNYPSKKITKVELLTLITGELTDKGRKLKEIGSIEGYNEHLKIQNDKALEREQLNDRLSQSSLLSNRVNLLIAIGVTVSDVYYILEILRIQYHLGLPFHVYFEK